jgi:hypothetical protein
VCCSCWWRRSTCKHYHPHTTATVAIACTLNLQVAALNALNQDPSNNTTPPHQRRSIPSSVPPHRYENECFEHLLAADMDILMGNIFIVSNRSPLSLLPSLPDTTILLYSSLHSDFSPLLSSHVTSHHVFPLIPPVPFRSLPSGLNRPSSTSTAP